MRKPRTIVLLATVFGVAATSGAQATPPGRDGAIAFTRTLYYADDCMPDWTTSIVSVRADGGRDRRLTREDQADDAAFSADGKRLAFVEGGNLMVRSTRGGTARKIYSNPDAPEGLGSPAWSPSGRKIAFGITVDRTTDIGYEIAVINANGTGLRIVGHGEQVDWSSTGKLAFESDVDNTIWVTDARGRHRHALTHGYAPSWSPDGRRLAVIRNGRGDRGHVYVVDVRSRRATRITSRQFDDSSPSWSPDGRGIAFARRGSIYEVAADGSWSRVLAKPGRPVLKADEMWYSDPAWQPLPNSTTVAANVEASRPAVPLAHAAC